MHEFFSKCLVVAPEVSELTHYINLHNAFMLMKNILEQKVFTCELFKQVNLFN